MEFHTTDELFTRLPTSSIRVALTETKKDAAAKEDELKSLVGTRYHNLLDSVHDAVSMHNTVERLATLLQALQQQCDDVDTHVTNLAQHRDAAAGAAVAAVAAADGGGHAPAGGAADAPPRPSPGQAMVAAQAFLRDVVEEVWAHCDAGRLHSAVVALLAARAVAHCVGTATCAGWASADLHRVQRDAVADLSHFIRHLRRCAETVLQRAGAGGRHPGLGAAVASIMLLQPRGAGGAADTVLRQLLSFRQTAVSTAMTTASLPADAALGRAAALIAQSIADAAALFEGDDAEVPALLAATAPAVVRVAAPAGALVPTSPEAMAQLLASAPLQLVPAPEVLTAPSAGVPSVDGVMDAWLADVVEASADAIPAVLERAQSPQQLADVRTAVLAACDASPQVWATVFQQHVAHRASQLLRAALDAAAADIQALVTRHVEELLQEPGGAAARAASVATTLKSTLADTFQHMRQLLDADAVASLVHGCVDALKLVVDGIRGTAAQLGAKVVAGDSPTATRNAALACLFLGRLAALLAGEPLLPAGADAGDAMAAIQRSLADVAESGTACWARWLGVMLRGLCSELLAASGGSWDTTQEKWLALHVAATVSVTVAAGGGFDDDDDDDDGGDDDGVGGAGDETTTDSFPVPAAVSGSALTSLSAFATAVGAADVDRATTPFCVRASEMALQQGMLGLLMAYDEFAAALPASVPDIARMQVLFDLSVLHQVVQQPLPLHPVAAAVTALCGDDVTMPALAPRPFDDVWGDLEASLDVVDWQMAKDYFDAGVHKAVAAHSLLLTPLAASSAAGPTGRPPPGAAAAAVSDLPGDVAAPVNALPLLPAVPRFALLPVPSRSSALGTDRRRPTASAFASALRRQAAGGGVSAGAGAGAGAGDNTPRSGKAVTDALKSKALSLMGQVGASNWFSSASSFLRQGDGGDGQRPAKSPEHDGGFEALGIIG